MVALLTALLLAYVSMNGVHIHFQSVMARHAGVSVPHHTNGSHP